MCIEKNVFDTIFMLLAAKDKENEDDIKSRKDLAMQCSRKELELVADKRKIYMPKA